MNLGDIAVGQVLYCHFTTRQFSTGAPITSAGLVLSIYKDDSTTESTAGITTTFSGGFDGRAGLVSVKIDTSADGTFYAAGHDFSLVVTTGTADSVSIVGENVRYFSIQNRYKLTAAAIATAVWQDSTAGDFATASSIGKSLYTAGVVPGGANGLVIAGSNAATTFAGLTTGALAATTITASGAVAFQSTFAVTTSTALGAVTATTIAASGTVTLNALTVTNNMLVSGNATVTGTTMHTGTVSYTNGVSVAGGTLVHALRLAAAAGGHGLYSTGNTTGSGIRADGGATGGGMLLNGGATSGDGFSATATTAGVGGRFTGVGDHGLILIGDPAGFGAGMALQGYYGLRAQGTEGVHIQTNNTNETAVFIQGGGDTPTGIVITGGTMVTGPTAGDAVTIAAGAGSGGAGISAAGDGAGLDITAPNNDIGSGFAGAVWDEAIAGHLNPGSTGEALNAAGGAGDPWITAIPGAYIAGQAGFIVGNLLDAAVSSRLASSSVTFDVPGYLSVNIKYVNDIPVNGTGQPGNTWGP